MASVTDRLLRHAPTTLLLAAAAAALPAQSVVTPLQFTLAEGPSNYIPVIASTTTPDRQLQVHDDLVGAPRTIHGMRFRLDGYQLTANLPAFQIVANAWLSNAATTAPTMVSNYPGNHGANKLQVMNQQIVSIAPTTWQALPGPFTLEIPFAVPFVYDGSTPLCWEIEVTSRTNNFVVRCDRADALGSSPGSAFLEFGDGCPAPGTTVPAHLGESHGSNWGTNPSLTVTYYASHLPVAAGGSGISVLALALDRLPAPITLPGAQGCLAYLAPDLLFLMLTQANGTANFTGPVPLSTSLNGANLFAQVAGFDTASGELTTTNVVQGNIQTPYPQAPVSVLRGAFNPTLFAGEGSIVEFY